MGRTLPVLFVMAPGGITRHFPEHLGTAFLRAVLADCHINSAQYLPENTLSLCSFTQYLLEHRPALVGFTAYETNLAVTRAMISAVRDALPDAVVLVGGPNATFTPEETLRILRPDGCVRGAAEAVIVPIVQRILGRVGAKSPPQILGDVDNLVLRAPDGAVHTRCSNLSSFPAQHFPTLDAIPSPFQRGLVSTADIGYLTSRGCNQNCIYCSFAAISDRKVVFNSVERVLDDLQALEMVATRTKRRNRAIQIFDDAFTLVPGRARLICEGIIQRGITLPLSCETRGDRVDAGLLQLMRRAGFISIAFGLESAVPRVLRTIGKVRPSDSTKDPELAAERIYLDRFRSAVQSARDAGLDVNVSIMGGLPGETPQDFGETLKFVESLRLKLYSHNILRIFPGTPLYETRRAFDLDAARDSSTGVWWTKHKYDVNNIPSLYNSTVRRWKWEAAERISDALCGRPRPLEGTSEGVWAIIVHLQTPKNELGIWLRNVLSIDGDVIVFADSLGDDALQWCSLLSDCHVPCRSPVWLIPCGNDDGQVFDVVGTVGAHRIRLVSSCNGDIVKAPIATDEFGNCRFSVFVGSDPKADITGVNGDIFSSIGPGLQIADSCKWWRHSQRCLRPSVLHVDSDFGVRPCWHGPIIGKVGDSLASIFSRSAALTQSVSLDNGVPGGRGCPLAIHNTNQTSSCMESLDIATQLAWMFPVGPAGMLQTNKED